MASFFDLFRRGNIQGDNVQGNIVEGVENISDKASNRDIIVDITESNLGEESPVGSVESLIMEAKTGYSPATLSNMISEDSLDTDSLIGGLRSVYNFAETYQENEEMSRDSIIGAAMEIMADDACQKDERLGTIVSIEAEDEKLQKFLNDFLTNNVGIEDRIWTWAFEIVKHGDLKLRRREYYAGSANSGIKNVYYEDVINPYLVSRIEYMGNILGFEDEDLDDVDPISNGSTGMRTSAKFEKADNFVHFMSSKLSRREKIRLRVRDKDDKLDTVVCYRVVGTSLVDNARYIFRINNMIDNMLVLSRIARSTQYNLVKIEVGNSSAGKTQQILMDTRRRIEGSTKIKKNVGMRTDPSPIPINSNVYIPLRDGKGDVNIESVGDNVDVRSIVDVDYFKDKEFAALKVPKQYLGFDEALSSLATNSLVKMDLRYARSVQRVQTILINGIKSLCNNYLRYRGRNSDVGKFRVKMRPLSTSENMSRVEEFVTNMQAVDSVNGMMQEYGDYIDKPKMLKSLLTMIGISPSEIASEEFAKILKEIEEGKYKESEHKKPKSEEEEEGW